MFGDWSRAGEKEAMFVQIRVLSIMPIYGHKNRKRKSKCPKGAEPKKKQKLKMSKRCF